MGMSQRRRSCRVECVGFSGNKVHYSNLQSLLCIIFDSDMSEMLRGLRVWVWSLVKSLVKILLRSSNAAMNDTSMGYCYFLFCVVVVVFAGLSISLSVSSNLLS